MGGGKLRPQAAALPVHVDMHEADGTGLPAQGSRHRPSRMHAAAQQPTQMVPQRRTKGVDVGEAARVVLACGAGRGSTYTRRVRQATQHSAPGWQRMKSWR